MKLSPILMSLALSAALFTVSAAADDYPDITDTETAFAVSVLENLDIVDGYPDGSFYPEKALTRAEFCKISIDLLGLEDKLSAASRMTIYSDVISTHWAAAYVNAASNEGLINGYGDGRFGPDDSVTYAQAVVICLRMLGYSELEIGEYYPEDYLNFADNLGLTGRMELEADSILTRGNAALLLSDMLACENKSGKLFCETLAADVLTDVILLDNDCVSPYGMLNAVKLYMNGQIVYYTHSEEISASMKMREGIALLDKHDRIFAFIPSQVRYQSAEGMLLSGTEYENGKAVVKMIIDNKLISYPRANSISSSLNGSSGILMLNEYGYAISFISDESQGMNITEDAILVSIDSTSDTGKKNCVLFYVNGQAVWYTKSGTGINENQIGSIGTLISNSDGELVSFVASGKPTYHFEYSVVTDVNSGIASFYNGSKIVRRSIEFKLSQNSVGSSGYAMIDKVGTVHAFIDVGGEDYSFTSEGMILIVDGTLYLLQNGKYTEYDVIGDISDSNIGAYGKIMLDSRNRAVIFIRESAPIYTKIEAESAEKDRVIISSEDAEIYRYIDEETDTVYNGRITKWGNIHKFISECELRLYYNSDRSIAFILILDN